MSKLQKFIELINFIKSFEKEVFQGVISYHKIPKEIMLYELFDYFQIYIFLKNKQDSNFIILDKYYTEFYETFDNVELSEQGIVNLYLDINRQEKYIRNVKIATFIIYKENWNVLNFEKFLKQKTFIQMTLKTNNYDSNK